MRPDMRWKYNLRGGGGGGDGMRGFPVRYSLFRFSDIFSSSMWNESSDCPGGEVGDLKGSLGRDVPPRSSNPDSV